MKTSDFHIKPSAEKMNESLNQKFGGKLDLENYTTAQLNRVHSLLETKIGSFKKSKFNDILENEEYYKLTMMKDVVKTAISERVMTKAAKGMMKYGKDGMKALAKAGKEGKDLDKVRDKYDRYDEAKKAKPDFLDLDKDGNKKESMKKAASDKKKKKVDESMQTMGELASHHAEHYAKHHRKGDLEHAMHHKTKCEECGGMLWHGDMGECWMKHAGVNNGEPKIILIKPEGMTGRKSPIGSSEVMTAEAKKAKPDFLDFDKDGNKKESMKKALKDKAKKKTSETIMRESIQRYLREGEEGKAEVIMAVKDMVDKFTGWSEDIAQMQANTAMEMADSIRDELGSDVAEQFKQAATPALDSAFQAVKAAREALNGMVGTITGEGSPAMGGEEMGAEPAMGGEEPAPDMGAEEPAPDMAGEEEVSDVAATPPEGREKRESIERTRRLSRILVGR